MTIPSCSPRRSHLLPLLCALTLMACEVDPLAQRTLPQLGTTFTSSIKSGADIYTGPDGIEQPPAGEQGIESVEPATGSPAGGETVLINGWGFAKGIKVFFDDAESPDVFYVNSKKLRVITPPHGLGAVDIALQWPNGKVKVLPSGFLYQTHLSITSVEPASGPITGGTPLTIRGTGFTEDASLVVGFRLALNLSVLDETTLVAVSPPGEEGGGANLTISSLAGVVTLKDAFTYTVRPRIDGLIPAAGPLAGGNEVEIVGQGFAPITEVLVGGLPATLLSAKPQSLRVVAPPGEAGYADVLVSGTWGYDGLAEGYYYLDEESPTVTLVPDSGPESGGTLVTLAGCGLPAPLTKVTFGDQEAEIIQSFAGDCVAVVKTPPGIGQVAVALWGTGETVTLPQSFEYLPIPTITQVAPQVGPDTGGTRITLTGTHFAADMQVLVGPLAAANVTVIDDTRAEATTPPGSPGLADITVVSSAGSAVRKAGFLYTVKEPEIWAISPNYGSRAGGTYIEILGAGFTQDALVFIGDNMATGVKVKSYGRIEAYAPPNGVGTYDLSVTVSVGQTGLANAYSYFDPTSWYGGTWGPAIDGAINVTVFQAGDWGPLEGATVILGSDPNTSYKGLTDANGHITFSGPGLTGPVDIHTTKKDHDAASFANVNAENATLYLIPLYPPSTGPTDPVEIPPPGAVSGHIVGLDKYVVVPPGQCKNKTINQLGLCSPCISNAQCALGTSCLAIGKTGKYCTNSCDASNLLSCPSGYICSPVGTKGDHCVPALGERTVKCQLSTNSIYSYLGMDDVVDAIPTADGKKMKYGLLDTRLGEVAVICLGGWTDPDTEQFHPMTMGVKRHVNINPGADLKDLNIWLNIPLSRTLRLRMDDPPEFDAYGGIYRVTAHLDLGSDGYFRLPGAYEGTEADDVELESLPAELSGDIYDASYLLYAGAYSNTYDDTPYSNLVVTELTELSDTSVSRFDGVEFLSDPAAPWDVPLYAGWPGTDSTVVVGSKGRVFKFANGSIYQLASVVDEPLYDIMGFPSGQLVAVGGSGVVVRHDGLGWALVGTATDRSLRAVWGSDPDDLHAVGPQRIVEFYEGQWHPQKVSQDLHDVWGSGPDDVWAVGAMGTIMHYDGVFWAPTGSPTAADLYAVHVFPDGRVIIAGDGTAWLRTNGTWTDLGLRPDFVARHLSVTSQGDIFMAGMSGEVARWRALTGIEYLPAPVNVRLNAVVESPDGELLGLGTPALLLSPMIPFPKYLSPLDGSTLAPLVLAWTYNGNADPVNLHNISITQKTGRSLWRLVIDGVRRQVPLPDFQQLIGFNPLPPGEKRLRGHSAYAPDFSINAFDLTALSSGLWTSWSYDMIAFDATP